MPANYTIETAYLGPFSSISEVNAPTLYKPSELGLRVDTGSRQYQQVQLDSGVLANATKGQLVYWKNQQPENYIVTNNNLFAGGTSAGRNFIAGVITPTNGVTAGYYTFIQQQGPCDFVHSANVTSTVGDNVVGNTVTGEATVVTLATAITVDSIGKITVAAANAATTQTAYLSITGAV